MKTRNTWIKSGFYLAPKIWHHFPISRLELLVLQGLAYFANSETGLSWPSIDKLAALVGCDRRTIQRALRGLEVCRAIAPDAKAGTTTHYRLNEYAIVSDDTTSTIVVALVEDQGGGVGAAPSDGFESQGDGVGTAGGAAYAPPGGGVGAAHNNNKNKNKDKRHADAEFSPREDDEEELVQQLSAAGVTLTVARGLVNKYAERVRRQLRWHNSRRKLRSPAAALVRAIQEDWQKPDGYREPVHYPDRTFEPDPEPGSPEYEEIKRNMAERDRVWNEMMAAVREPGRRNSSDYLSNDYLPIANPDVDA